MRPQTSPPPRRTLAKDVLNIPNILTLGRICAIPFFVWLLDSPTPRRGFWACIVFTAAAITDLLDGYLARKLGVVSVLGKFLDPLADKLMVITVLVILASQSLVPSWVVVVVAAREFLITGLRSVAAGQGVVVSSTQLGKSKAFTQNIMILLIILAQPYPPLEPAAVVFIWIAVIATVLSGLDYLWRYRRFII
jgi:CDP-diacylglycerol--glycerol-3-phosphate 3-phosphatidyltransferase